MGPTGSLCGFALCYLDVMLEGECYCGEVHYQIDGDIKVMYSCHCSRCRKMSGASCTTNGIVNAEQFRFTKGKEHLAQFGAGEYGRFVCSHCFTWLYACAPQYPGVMFVPCGTLNTDPGKQIEYHCWVDSKAPWVEITDGLHQFPGLLPDEIILGN